MQFFSFTNRKRGNTLSAIIVQLQIIRLSKLNSINIPVINYYVIKNAIKTTETLTISRNVFTSNLLSINSKPYVSSLLLTK